MQDVGHAGDERCQGLNAIGVFRLNHQVTPGDLVSFTFVGMADKVVKVQAGKKVVNVKMETNESHWFEASKAQNLDKWIRIAEKAVEKFGQS